MQSLITSKKEGLLDQLLNSIEEENLGPEDSPRSRSLWTIITNFNGDTWEQSGPILEEDKLNLTRFFRRNEHPRTIKHLGRCREWAIEDVANWKRIIAEGRELLLQCAREHNDTQFLEAVRRFETRGGR
jgi:hypothetical protein